MILVADEQFENDDIIYTRIMEFPKGITVLLDKMVSALDFIQHCP